MSMLNMGKGALLLTALCLWMMGPVGSPPAEAAQASPGRVAELAGGAGQLVLITGTGGSNARLSLHERDGDGTWRQVLSTRAYVGKKGFGKTKEGDMKTPVGTFRFTMAFGIQPDPGAPMGYTQVDSSHYWCGDSNSPHYNQFVSTRDHNDFNKKDSEHIIDYTTAYAYAMNISYNEDGRPGLGSAIFLHCQTKNKFTAGCVAIPEKDMIAVLRRTRPGCAVVLEAR